MNVFFDIETIPCQLPGVKDELATAVQAPAQYKKPESIAEWLRENRATEAEAAWLKTSFDGGLGHVCVIGWAVDDEPAQTLSINGIEDEASLLRLWFGVLADRYRATDTPHFIGHNIIGFDLPFLWKRAMVLGVKPPIFFPRNPSKYRSESVQDTMLLWDSEQRHGGSMDRICKLMGIPGKGDIDGSKVWPMVAEGRINEVADYCAGDVTRTRAMWQRMTFQAAA